MSNDFLEVGFQLFSGPCTSLSYSWSASLWHQCHLAHARLHGDFLPNSPDLVALWRRGGNETTFRAIVQERMSHWESTHREARKWALCCLPLLLHSCTVAETKMAHTRSLPWEKKRQVCLFIFQPSHFLLLKWYFHPIVKRVSDTSGSSQDKVIHPPTTYWPMFVYRCLPMYSVMREIQSLSFLGITKKLIQVTSQRVR